MGDYSPERAALSLSVGDSDQVLDRLAAELARDRGGATGRYWPDAALDTQMSRQEASRRLLLSGIDQLREARANEQQVNSYAQSLQPPVDKTGPTLPVGPE